ncbi:unnamed protein product [Adineta ricciae]|uniref:Kazal-like domain-containing protein n=1 Tax=Adineta ricciae TaxID=249248 RepID=A0A814Q523_ADIRI|nr:unnamed protein product [Adineta ricciae]
MSFTINTTTLLCLILSSQLILITQGMLMRLTAGNCFFNREMDVCYDVSEIDVTEEQCTGPYYSEDILTELDGYVYSENCRDANASTKRCDIDCGIGRECQWIDREATCVCSEAACTSSNTLDQQPVCASNNQTFRSECHMHAWACANHRSALYKKYDGECQKDCRNVRCPHDTVCLLVKNTGEPMCYPKKHCNPALDPEPVCGTNGVTYPNICAMRLSRDRRGYTPDLAHKGPCVRECHQNLCAPSEKCIYSKHLQPTCILCQYPPQFFTRSGECSENIPVCGSNGNLYKNYCSLLVDQCIKSQYIKIIDYQTCPVIRYRDTRLKQQSASLN